MTHFNDAGKGVRRAPTRRTLSLDSLGVCTPVVDTKSKLATGDVLSGRFEVEGGVPGSEVLEERNFARDIPVVLVQTGQVASLGRLGGALLAIASAEGDGAFGGIDVRDNSTNELRTHKLGKSESGEAFRRDGARWAEHE